MSAEGLDDEVARWLAYADGDLLAARTLITNHDIDRRIICSLAQQAAEKSLKAALIAEGIEPPRTHNLDSLIDLLSPESPLRRSGGDLASLTFWAVESRYPTEYQWEELEELLRRALSGMPRQTLPEALVEEPAITVIDEWRHRHWLDESASFLP